MEASLVKGKEINLQDWADLLAHSGQASFFVYPAYMDIIAPGWQAVEVRDQGKLMAVMPLNIKRKGGYQYSLQPPFAQYWGLIIRDSDYPNDYKKFSELRKICVAAIEAIPSKLKWFSHTFSPESPYLTPFHWHQYALTMRFTYRLQTDQPEEVLWGQLDKSKRADITQAQKYLDEITVSADPKAMLDLMEACPTETAQVLAQNKLELFRELAEMLCKNMGGRVILGKKAGKVIAAGLFVYEKTKCTYLAGIVDNGHRKSGAMKAVLWKAICENIGEGRIFDFEGSMIEPIESFFRSFSAAPVPYAWIQKNQLPLLLQWIRNSR